MVIILLIGCRARREAQRWLTRKDRSRRHATIPEVEPGRISAAHARLARMAAFDHAFKPRRKVLVGGGDGVSLDEFFGRPAEYWLR
ncbi:MAG TPA: hypothetical protein VFA81_11055 [Burkholderiales bacterium]|nr:hypothetical protein [Burkholderiales bacterium]